MGIFGQTERHGEYVTLTNEHFLYLMGRYYQALEDTQKNEVTGLPNRTGLLDFWRENQRRLTRDGVNLGEVEMAVVFGDLRKFKRVNDRYGDRAGDRLLSDVGQALTNVMRPGEIVGNPHGDSFVAVIFAGRKGAEKVKGRFERVVKKVNIVSRPKGGGDEEQVGTGIKLKCLVIKASEDLDSVLDKVDELFYDEPREI